MDDGISRHNNYPMDETDGPSDPVPSAPDDEMADAVAAAAAGAPPAVPGGGAAPPAGPGLGPEADGVLEGYESTDDLIGQGAYGVVYRGTSASGETVAIKKISFAESVPDGGVPCNVIREISLLRELDHPNVVRLMSVIQANAGSLYLIFEYVDRDLKKFMDDFQTSPDISERRGLPTPMVKSFLQQILAGVGFCHKYRILHRDLKPHNLLISGDGRTLKLADFGLARLFALPNGPYTHEVVTLWYRAPELLFGDDRYCTHIDVWSVGCIFGEMATGFPMFTGRSDIDQLFKIFQRRGTPTERCWPGVSRLPHYNSDFPQWPERPVTGCVPAEALGGAAGADLLERMLCYNPEERIVCKQALNHPYFFET
eukprot:CAMPEP_0194277654 /NCGR_PEP_ID=MMETSP0169-20130528/9917_1 /TAXON_ID=218684 /ORGANISM="Corethron pennatum, Strain L29A3" /LENGTH=369 /DNA_ID=CAMNT_0039021671 /DNA_START=239 /DNA_END=1348 /DNA_ORIENTATION=+